MVLPRVFGEEPVKSKVLPLGYCSDRKPDPEKICDMPSCTVMDDTKWVLFKGCSHSFHQICISEITYCPLCQKFLQERATNLASTAKNAILNPKERSAENNKRNEVNEPDSEVSCNDTSENPQIDKCEIKDVEGNIAAIISRISALAALSPQSQQTRQQQQQQQES